MSSIDLAIAEHSVQPTLERLRRLCLDSPDPKFLCDLLMFVGTRESTEIHADWASESDHGAGLERLARAVWGNPTLLEAIDPRRTALRVEERYSPKELRLQYPAALAAARRPLQSEVTSRWIQRLRHYLLIRQLDALEANAPREKHIYDVAVTVRDVCQMTSHPRLAWLEPLVGLATSLIEFEADTIIRARQARRAAQDSISAQASGPEAAEAAKAAKAQVRFYDALLAILEHKPWDPMPVALPPSRGRHLPPYPSAPGWGDLAGFIEKLRREPTSQPAQIGDPDHGGLTLVPQQTSKRHSQKTKQRLGTKVRLEHLAETLCLPVQWTATTSGEDAALQRRVEELLESGPLPDRFGAACVLVAQLAGQSMHDVETIPFVASKTHAWHLDIQSGQLQRLAPRFERRWRREGLDAEALGWLKPMLDRWTYQLHDKVASVLEEAASAAPQANTLGAVWDRIGGGVYLERWFALCFVNAPGLARLSSPNVSSSIGLHAFRQSGDLALARLVSSDHRTALPAACAYGAYSGRDVSAALDTYAREPLATLVQPRAEPDVNAAGSELDLVISRVADALRGLTDRIDKSATSGDWVKHHNLLTSLVTLALLASTGARPVNSPFESLSWFDLERSLLFVEDKVAGPTRGSRVCILSDFARDLIQDHYLPHLRKLASAIAPRAPRFAAEIERVVCGDSEARMPLLFMLRCRPSLDWVEVSESQLDLTCAFGWPLPWNLFRHWMSTELRRGGVHPDIRDALLGHADRNAEPHGDFSPRVPAKDFVAARPVVNRMQSQLGWKAPSIAGPSPAGLSETLQDPMDGRAIAFGRRARQERRKQTHEDARRQATSEIDAYLNGRTIDQLTGDELDELARQMLFRKTMPHVLASLRYEVFENVVREQWRKLGKQAKAQRRYVLALDGDARFTDEALQAHRALAHARTAFEAMLSSKPDRREGPVMAAALAAVDIVLYSGLAYMAPLAALVTNAKTQYRLVLHQDRYWFEWGFGAEWHDGKPVLRIEISRRAAQWIGIAFESDRKLKETPDLPGVMLSFSAKVAPDALNVGTLLRGLINVRDQVNVFDLPGYQAAFLAGRRSSAALPHLDWIRLISGAGAERPAALKAVERGELIDDDGAEEALTYFRTHRRPSTVTAADALVRCRSLIDDITKVLAESEPPEEPSDVDTSAMPNDGRRAELAPEAAAEQTDGVNRDIAQTSEHQPGAEPGDQSAKPKKRGLTNGQKAGRIKSLVDSSGFGHGAAPFLLAHFIVHVLTRRPKKGKRDRLRGSTAYRYWMSLAGPFCDAVAGKNFIGADEEDLTEWYAAIVDAWDSALDPPAEETKEQANTTETAELSDEPQSDAPLRTMRQLVDFHRFMQDTYGATDPDWADVAPDLIAPVGRPGLILHREYLATLNRVIGLEQIAGLTTAVLQRAFVLIACYRFGLRTSEAVGLSRRDWIDAGQTQLVAIRSNHVRPLKTSASRRIVPLLEPLTALEQGVITRVLDDWKSHDGMDPRTPLLRGVRRDTIASIKASIGAALLDELKAVTWNPGTTVHMLRHSFAMRITACIMDLELEPGAPSGHKDNEALRLTLLGSKHADRRALWAVARVLGHAAPTCTLLSYVNCLHLWLPARAAPNDGETVSPHAVFATQCIDLDRYPKPKDYLPPPQERTEHTEEALAPGDKFLRGMEYIRLMVIGKAEAEAEADAKLPKGFGHLIGAALARASSRIPDSEKRYAGFKILGKASPGRFRELIDRSAAVPGEARDHGARVTDWLYTIGKSRQVLAYRSEHFNALAAFIAATGLSERDVIFVHSKAAHRDHLIFAERASLNAYLVPVDQVPIGKDKVAKAFQLDVAALDEVGTEATQRMAMIPRVGGAVGSTHELATLWVMWNLSVL
jgi:integrase